MVQSVCIQGLGFVGAAMAVAVASARDPAGNPYFDVIGLELPTPLGEERVAQINRGLFPFANQDDRLKQGMAQAVARGNLRAVTDPAVLATVEIIVVDVGLDLGGDLHQPALEMAGFRRAVTMVGEWMAPGALVIVETTVPPGTCDKIVAPLLAAALTRRGISPEAFLLAHAYERVMPGSDYLDSIVNFWRVYAGQTPAAATACENFLAKVVNVREYPLTRLANPLASETAKVLENSYRAVNIAFMEEWGRFAERAGIDLFEVVRAIRQRPTHANLRQPGFGVGGYCLTKDPLFALLGAQDLLGLADLDFPFCRMAVALNREMPLVTLEMTRAALGGSLQGQHLLLLGVSYRQDVGDTRHSPSQPFVEAARSEGATVWCHDPLVRYWEELAMELPETLPDPSGMAAIILAVPHADYRELEFSLWLGHARPIIVDGNDCLTAMQRQSLEQLGCAVYSIGRGRSG